MVYDDVYIFSIANNIDYLFHYAIIDGVYMIKKRLGQLRYLKHPGQVWRVLTSKVKSIELAVNFVCNRRCPGCYARNLRAEQEKVFLTPKEVKEIWKKYKPAHINLTGGEPMLNPHIYNIIKAIPKSCVVSMVTNGDMFPMKDQNDATGVLKLDKLKKAGLNTIQLSYGSNYDMHNNKLIGLVADRLGINVCLSCTNIYKERENIKNAIKIAEIHKFGKKKTWQVLYNTPGVGLEDQFDYQTYFTYRRHPLVREDNLFWAGCDTCPAGIQKFYITADKSIYPCDRLHDKKYDSYEQMRAEFKDKPKTYCHRFKKICDDK